MLTKTDACDDIIISAGICVSLVDIQTIMSIVLLIFNILWLVAKLGFKLYKYIKNDGKLDKNEIDDLLSDVDDIKDKVGDKDE